MQDRKSQLLAAALLYGAYLQARKKLLVQAERNGERIGPKWLGLLTWRLMKGYSDLVGVRLASEGGEGLDKLDPNRRHIIVWHPHGFIAWSPLFVLSRLAVVGHPIGREWFCMVAPALFRIPLFSEAIMLINGRQVDKATVENLLGEGKSIALQPGGIKEQIATRSDQEQAIFPANLGFVRMALKYGMDLLPLYVFNENQLYDRIPGMGWATNLMHRVTGFGMPFVTGKLGLPQAVLLPRQTDIHVRWGSPVQVGDPDPCPSDERVEAVFASYLQALRDLFAQHAPECLPAEVAAKGLKIIRLDGKPVPMDERIPACLPQPLEEMPMPAIDGPLLRQERHPVAMARL